MREVLKLHFHCSFYKIDKKFIDIVVDLYYYYDVLKYFSGAKVKF